MLVVAGIACFTLLQSAAYLLVISGWRHWRNRDWFVRHLQMHRILPAKAVALAARTLPVVSVVVGVTAIVAPLLAATVAPASWQLVSWYATVPMTIVYLFFLGYLVALRRRSPEASCGCLGMSGERTEHSIARAAIVLGAGALAIHSNVLARLTDVEHWPVLHLMATALAAAIAAGISMSGAVATAKIITAEEPTT